MRVDAEKRGGVRESRQKASMAASCTPASVPLAREYPNFVTHLECSYSGKAYPKQVVHELCTCCDKPKPLIVKYDLAGIRASLTKKELRERTEPGFWKYREFLPVESTRNVSSLGEVCTPLIKLRTYNPGGAAVLVKDEVRPPRSCACTVLPAQSALTMMHRGGCPPARSRRAAWCAATPSSLRRPPPPPRHRR